MVDNRKCVKMEYFIKDGKDFSSSYLDLVGYQIKTDLTKLLPEIISDGLNDLSL